MRSLVRLIYLLVTVYWELCVSAGKAVKKIKDLHIPSFLAVIIFDYFCFWGICYFLLQGIEFICPSAPKYFSSENLFNLFLFLMMMFFPTVFLAFLFNSAIELILRFIHMEAFFQKKFMYQKYGYNYVLNIISLAAIYIAVSRYNEDTANTILLTCGMCIFALMVINDLYYEFYWTKDIVKNIYERLVSH